MSVPEDTPGAQLKSSIFDASRKIESIIDDAERAAAEIRAEARAEAERESRRAIAESAAQLSAVVDPLVKRVENLRAEAASLMQEIESATLTLAKLTAGAGGGATEASVSPIPVPESAASEAEKPEVAALPPDSPVPVAYPGTGGTQGATGKAGPPDEAVLRATQMAVAGNSREEIESTLQDEFGLDDPSSLANDILGSS